VGPFCAFNQTMVSLQVSWLSASWSIIQSSDNEHGAIVSARQDYECRGTVLGVLGESKKKNMYMY